MVGTITRLPVMVREIDSVAFAAQVPIFATDEDHEPSRVVKVIFVTAGTPVKPEHTAASGTAEATLTAPTAAINPALPLICMESDEAVLIAATLKM